MFDSGRRFRRAPRPARVAKSTVGPGSSSRQPRHRRAACRPPTAAPFVTSRARTPRLSSKQTNPEKSVLDRFVCVGTSQACLTSSAETSTLWQPIMFTMTYEESGKPTAPNGNLALPSCRGRQRLTNFASWRLLWFTILPFAQSADHAWRHIPCHRSVQHAGGLDRDTGARSQAPSRAHRSTSTTLRLRRIAACGSRP